MTAPLPCPRCGSREVVPILWGLPNQEDFEAAKRGEVVLVGCIYDPDHDPHRACKSCGHQWDQSGNVRDQNGTKQRTRGRS